MSCPPIQWSCHYGIDFATREELIAANKSVDEIREFLGVDSLGYLSKDRMLACMKDGGADFCTACFDGTYPVVTSSSWRATVDRNTCASASARRP